MAWIQKFLYFLRKLLRNSPQQSVRILESYYGDQVAVLRLQDSGIPGIVELWRVDRYYERVKFFICVVNTSAFRQDLPLLGSNSASNGSRGQLASHIYQSMAAQKAIAASHYWITGFDVEYSGVDSQGRSYRSYRLDDVVVYAVDLQGTAGPYAGDRHAIRFARKAVKQLALNEFREYQQHQTWQAAVKAVNWLQWLEGMARAKDGISPDHVLQPKRAWISLREDPDEF